MIQCHRAGMIRHTIIVRSEDGEGRRVEMTFLAQELAEARASLFEIMAEVFEVNIQRLSHLKTEGGER